jgi:phytanoyl-CoA hydroxylase
MLNATQRAEWDRDGFVVIPGFADENTCEAMLADVIEAVRCVADGGSIAPSFVMPEARAVPNATQPEDHVSKLFRVHREREVFKRFACDRRLLGLIGDLIGGDIDCFLSQFIFKVPGAMGQPWHQDAHYFPFDRGPQIGVWLAITDTTLENGPLWVLPGSHAEPVHDVITDPRKDANYGYVEIVDHDTGSEIPVLLGRGDLLLFHSHLFHKSTDNVSGGRRAAMVYHYADSNTVDRSKEENGFVPPNIDWMPVVRAGTPVASGAVGE